MTVTFVTTSFANIRICFAEEGLFRVTYEACCRYIKPQELHERALSRRNMQGEQ